MAQLISGTTIAGNVAIHAGNIGSYAITSLSGYATQSYVTTQIANLVASAPAALDTLNELATALGNDASFSTTITNSIAGKVAKSGDTMSGNLSFGNSTRQMINLWGTQYGIGIQSSTQYFRTDGRFSWFYGGTHSDTENTPGTGGTNLMTLTSAGNLTVTGTLTASGYNKTNWDTAYGWGNHASAGYLTGITSSQVTTALGYTPYNSTNPNGYITGITSGMVTTALGYTPANSSHNHTSLTGVTSIAFSSEGSDSSSISTTISGTSTYFDFNLTDDNNNDEWRWRFTPSGASVYNAMRLVPVSNTASNLIVSGSISASGYNDSNWNTAYNKRPTAISFSGTSTKTLTLTQGDGSTLTASFTDIDTDTNTDAQTLSLSGNVLSISGGNSVTLSSSGLSQATADGLYVAKAGGSTVAGITYFSNGESMQLYGIRGRYSGDGMHLYGKVDIGNPNGWGAGIGNAPNFGLSTYGGAYFAYNQGTVSIGALGTAKLHVIGNTSGQELFAVDGVNGRLFSVVDDLSDSLYSVNTIAGLPVLEVFANNVVTIGKFGTNAIYVGQDGRVGFGTTDFSYTAADQTSPTNNRLFVNGSIQLLGNNDAIVFGRGTATVLRDEKLAFGWGSGWYMEDNSYLRVVGSATIYTPYSARFDDSLYLGGATYRLYSANSGIWTNGNLGASGDLYLGTRSTWLSSWLNQSVQTGAAPTFADVYVSSWFRNNANNTGLYNQTNGNHFYSRSGTAWGITGNGGSIVQLQFRTNHESTVRGSVYGDGSGFGLLDSGDNWRVRVDTGGAQVYGSLTVGNTTSSDIYMTDTDETTRRIHTNSGRIGFLTSSNGWGAYCDNSGNWYANNFSGSSSGVNTGDQTNISGNAATATNVAWTGVTGRPTALSQFTNDLGNYGGWITSSGSISGNAATVTINYSNDSNSTYQMLWGSGNSVYGTAGVYVNPNSDTIYSGGLRGSGNVGGTGEATWHPAGIYSGSTQWLYGHTYRNQSHTYGQGYIYQDGNYGYGLVGLYASTRFQAIFAMGDSYKQAADGTGLGTLYGLSWTHSNVGGQGSYVSGHQLLVVANGQTLSAISTDIWARGNISANGGVYDSGSRVAISRGEGRNYVDYSRYVYNNGAYSGTGWTEPSDLGVRYANTAGSAPANGGTSTYATYLNPLSGDGNYKLAYTANGARTNAGEWGRAVMYYVPNGQTYGIRVDRADYADGAGSVAWSNVSGRPTSLSEFSNNLGNYGGWITSSGSISGSSGSTNAVNSTGWGNGNFTWYQTPSGLSPYTGSWASFLVSNHGDGSNYYNQTIIMPFWGAPQYSRREGGNNRGPWTFWTTENLDPNSISGNFYASGTITAGGDVVAYSDIRLKTNIKTIENALDKTLALRGVSYNRIDSEDNKTKIGVIAQETLEVIPEVVNQDANGMYNVSYGNMTALLIEAIKEQQAQIEDLKSEIKKLRGE